MESTVEKSDKVWTSITHLITQPLLKYPQVELT